MCVVTRTDTVRLCSETPRILLPHRILAVLPKSYSVQHFHQNNTIIRPDLYRYNNLRRLQSPDKRYIISRLFAMMIIDLKHYFTRAKHPLDQNTTYSRDKPAIVFFFRKRINSFETLLVERSVGLCLLSHLRVWQESTTCKLLHRNERGGDGACHDIDSLGI